MFVNSLFFSLNAWVFINLNVYINPKKNSNKKLITTLASRSLLLLLKSAKKRAMTTCYQSFSEWKGFRYMTCKKKNTGEDHLEATISSEGGKHFGRMSQ